MTTTKHEHFKIEQIHRSEIHGAPYNPRKINDYQKQGLKRNLKKVGLLQPIIWNRVTGNIVSGHQRIAIIDQLEKTEDYYLTVAVVELDEKTEKEQNIFMNATTFTGEFDFDLLAEMMPDIDVFSAGLDEYDLNIIGVTKEEESVDSDNDDDDVFADIQDKKKKVKDAKKASANSIDSRFEDGERYVTLSFSDYKSKAAFMIKMGLNAGDMYIKGEEFEKIIKNAYS
jgi:hypothetical protein